MLQRAVSRLPRFLLLAVSVVHISMESMAAQSPLGLRNTGGGARSGKRGIAANNPWLGSQVAYRFGETSEFASNLLVAGQVVYPLQLGNFPIEMPIIGNVSTLAQALSAENTSDNREDQIKQLLSSTNGITIGLFPYSELTSTEKQNFLVTAHGFAAWRVNALRPFGVDTTSTDLTYLHQGKFGVGLELLIGARSDGSSPMSVSVTPTITAFGRSAYERAFGESRGSISTIELTSILPVQNGVGVAFEAVIAEDLPDAFRVGVLLASPIGGRRGGGRDPLEDVNTTPDTPGTTPETPDTTSGTLPDSDSN